MENLILRPAQDILQKQLKRLPVDTQLRRQKIQQDILLKPLHNYV
jgi:hypothetical protein